MTLVWISGGLIYFNLQADNLGDTHIDELGGFLEGAFAPLAFLWLVIGIFIQQKELADNTEVMRQSMLQHDPLEHPAEVKVSNIQPINQASGR